MFRQSLLKNYTEETLIRVSDEEANFLEKFAKFITGNNIADFLETFSDAGGFWLQSVLFRITSH